MFSFRIDTFQGHVKFPVVSEIIKKGHLCGGLNHGLPYAGVIRTGRLIFHERMVDVLPESVTVFELELIEMVKIKIKRFQDGLAQIFEQH